MRERKQMMELQETECATELQKISEIVQEMGGEEGGGGGMRHRLEGQLRERYERERMGVEDRQRVEQESLGELRERKRVVKVDGKVLEKAIEEEVHQHAMQLDM